MSISIRAIGSYRGPSGYDRLMRGFARGMIELGVHLQLVPVAGWSPELPSSANLSYFDAHTAELDPDFAVHFMMPDRCQFVPGLRNANYTMFEAARIPDAWVECSDDHDAVILPTESCRDAWRDSGVLASKLWVCGLAVDGEYFAQEVPPLDLSHLVGRPLESFRCRFLQVGELRPRKNHLGLLRMWLRATTRESDAILILKCIAPAHDAAQFNRDLTRMKQRLGRTFSDAAPVLFLNATLADGEMRSLYHAATHYISLSHAEAWDLPIMEAAAAGLSLIAPDHSHYRAYLQSSDADWITSHAIEIRAETSVGVEDLAYFCGLSWWQPDEEVAVETVARIIASDQRRPPPAARMLSDFTWARASQRLLDVLEALR